MESSGESNKSRGPSPRGGKSVPGSPRISPTQKKRVGSRRGSNLEGDAAILSRLRAFIKEGIIQDNDESHPFGWLCCTVL